MIEAMSLTAAVLKKDDNEHSLLVYQDHIVKRRKASAASSMQYSLQHVPPTLSQVSKINRQSIHNFVKNDGYSCSSSL